MIGPIKIWLVASSCLAASPLAVCALAAEACELEQVTRMPLITLGEHVAVMVQINKAMRPMMVDTGAATTMLTAQVIKDLKIAEDPDFTKVKAVIGIGQTSAVLHLNALPETFGLGDLVFHDRSTVVGDMSFGILQEQKAVGLVGDDILSRYDVEFDFAGKTLSFYDAKGCYDTFIPWTGPYAQIPFDHHGDKIVADLILDGERTRAIVDTGNNISFVTRGASALFGAPNEAFVDTKSKSTSPLNGGTSSQIQLYGFRKVQLGDEIFRNRALGVISVELLTGAANIGLDYFKGHKLWISYRNNVMFVAREPAASKLAYPVSLPVPPPTLTASPAPSTADAGPQGYN